MRLPFRRIAETDFLLMGYSVVYRPLLPFALTRYRPSTNDCNRWPRVVKPADQAAHELVRHGTHGFASWLPPN